MKVKQAVFLALVAIFLGSGCGRQRSLQRPVVQDVVIYGGTSAGVSAAVQAARMHLRVILIEPSQHVGGLTTSGLGATDTGDKSVIGGLSREFYQRVKKHYDRTEAWNWESPEALTQERRGRPAYEPEADAIWVFEPKVAEEVLEKMLAEEGVQVIRGQRLNRTNGVEILRRRIMSIQMESGETYKGAIFVDATYEGDLMAAAGVSYHVGREANEVYGETLNGVQKARNVKKHRFTVPVDPYVAPGEPQSGLLPGVHGDDPGTDGEGDHRVQAYCFRMCMSRVPENRVAFPKPEGYDEARYELLLRNFEAGDESLPLSISPMPNGKTDTNNSGAFSTDNIGMNYTYPEATYEEREKIVQEHETYQKGLMWTLANHPRVPESIRQRMSQWGLAADEFTGNGNWPRELYIREARRMIGAYVTTELDCRRERVAEDSVGLGSYNMDSHNVQRYITPEGTVQNEGDIQVSPGGPYVISYRSIIPREEECRNLFVPAAVSSSHIAFGSIRMEPVFMILGQSCATAASIAIEEGYDVQEVPYDTLREQLLAQGQVLDLPEGWTPKRILAAKSLPGIAVDDEQAALVGAWDTSSSVQPYVGEGYRHDSGDASAFKSATYTAALPTPGRYVVKMNYTPNGNRGSQVPVTVQHRGGAETLKLDQRKNEGDSLGFVTLGTYEFEAGEATVTVTNENAGGYVVIDAVTWERQE